MHRSCFRLALAAIALVLTQQSALATEIWLAIDQVQTRNFKSPVGQIVVGNPSIADVQVGANQQIFFYGKGLGLTNITFFDLQGNQIDNISVRVQNPSSGFLVMHNGLEQVSYSCTVRCQAVASIGDDATVFSTIRDQVTGKVESALSAASSLDRDIP